MGNKSKRVVKTQDKPFDLDALEREAKAKVANKNFEFILNGTTFSLPPFGTLDRKVLTDMDPNDPESIMGAFKAAMDEDQYEVFNGLNLSIEGLNALESAWTEHSGITPGE